MKNNRKAIIGGVILAAWILIRIGFVIFANDANPVLAELCVKAYSYIIIEGNTPGAIYDEVGRKLFNGYTLAGGIAVDDGRYYQAMMLELSECRDDGSIQEARK